MPTPTRTRPVVRFGSFEVDLEAAELRHKGLVVRIQEQPFRVLAALLERPGEIVTREQLRERLWPSDTFVDFEHSVNAAIKKLRQALRDDADSPRFVETIPRRGYRFIAPIALEAAAAPQAQSAGGAPTKTRPRWLPVAAAAGMAVLAVVLVSVTTFLASANKPIRSIAVLPFVNLSSDAEQEYFTDGMTDELITDLAKTSGLLVISHTSVERYKNTTLPLPSIARELGVDAVVEGRVLRSEGRVRISAQLIDTRTDRHIWADSYERELGDVLSLQDELARRIAAEVGVKMTRRLETAARAVNPAAHDAYMKGNFYWNRLTCDGFKRGREYFQQSVNRDPNFALAYVGLAQSYFTLWDWGCAPTADVIAQSKAAVLRAIDLDPGMGEAHAWLGKILFFSERDWEHAEQQLTQAIALNPNYAHAHTMYSVLLVARGRQEQGFAEMRRSLELDPTSELTNVVSTFAFYLAHQYDRAIEQGKKTAELYPNSSALYFWLAAAYERKGLYDQAVSAYLKEKAFAGVPASEVAAFRGAYDSGGIRGYWRRELDAAKANTTGNACWTAMIYGHLGDEQGALEALNRGLQQHCSGLHLLNVDPLYDGFRSDPGFQALMRRARM